MNPTIDNFEEFADQTAHISGLYQQAPTLAKQGVHVVSCDEKTGIQALSQIAPRKLPAPGMVEKREAEYARHGTVCLIANLEVATGKVITPTIGETRTEEDFVKHIRNTVGVDPKAKWIFVVDQLNTHVSAGLARFVAESCAITIDLGEKGRAGVLQNMDSRREFLSNHEHRIQFVYTPKHCSWMNQIEIWFGILVRRLLKRSSFDSCEQLTNKIRHFIDYFNTTLAKPFRWTFTGIPLRA